ncbi:MAG: hypothetical protein AAFQ68_09765, partial [Bacteroidota bacterium]
MLPVVRYWLIAVLVFAGHSLAQSPLDQRISIHFEEQPLEQALQDLAEAAQCSFSYNPGLLPLDQIIDHHYRRTRLS